MLFTQPIFIAFFAVVFIAHWSLRGNAARKLLLLVASYLFYAAWDWRFLSLILASTLIDFIVGLALVSPAQGSRRRSWLIVSLVGNLGILGFFKYFDFFVTSTRGGLALLGVDVPEASLHIVLPVGISFFTFQSMSYTIDVYRGQLAPVRSFVDFALYVAFFPQLVAGPIVRAREFLPQLAEVRRVERVAFKSSIGLFLIGFFKKAVIADQLAPIIDPVFASPGAHDALSIWLAVIFFAVQIYCDFSGYTDMAIAVARMLGYELAVNFDFPYFAANVTDFWRRWHISLSTWLRDYLYISLGGNRGSATFVFRNLMVTMILGGLWHGASWSFVIWGALHGLALCVHRVHAGSAFVRRLAPAPRAVLGAALTLYWICLTWIFFRAPDLGSAMVMLDGFVTLRSSGGEFIDPRLGLWLVPLVVCHALAQRGVMWRWVEASPDWLCAAGYGAAAAVLLLFVPFDPRPFIYFQF